MPSFRCLCGKKISAPEDWSGRRVKCPKCGQPVTVPGKVAADGPSDSSAAAPSMNPFLDAIAALDDSPAAPQIVRVESITIERSKPLSMAAIWGLVAAAILVIAVLTYVVTRSSTPAAPSANDHPALADARTPAPVPVDVTKPSTAAGATTTKRVDTPAPAPLPWNLPIKASPQIKVKSQEFLSLHNRQGSVDHVMLDLGTPHRVVVKLNARELDENKKPLSEVKSWLMVIDPSEAEPPQYGRLEQHGSFNDAHQGKVVVAYSKEHVFRIATVQDQVVKTLHEVSPRVGDAKLPADFSITTGVTAKLTNSGNLVYGPVEVWSLPPTRRIVCVNPQTQQTVWSLDGDELGQMSMSPTRDWVIVTNDRDLLFLNPDTGRVEARIPSIPSKYEFGYLTVGLSFSPDGRRLAVIHRNDEKVFVYDMATGTRLHTFAIESDVKMACFTEDSNYLLCGLRGFDLNTGRQVWRYRTQGYNSNYETFNQARYWYGHLIPGVGNTLVAAELLTPDIAAQIEQLRTAGKPLLAPGMRIALEITMPGDAAKVEQFKKSVTRTLTHENQLIIDPAAPLKFTIKGTITPGDVETGLFDNPRDQTQPRRISVQKQHVEFTASLLDAQSQVLWTFADRFVFGIPLLIRRNEEPQQAAINSAYNWLHFTPLRHLPPPTLYPNTAAGSGESQFNASGLQSP